MAAQLTLLHSVDWRADGVQESLMSLLLLLPLLASSTADNIQISHYPGNNLWQGESLILECRVSGITRFGGKVEAGGSLTASF